MNLNNHIAIGEVKDIDELHICPKCASEDVFNTKEDIGLCRYCWHKEPFEMFIADRSEYYGEAEANNY